MALAEVGETEPTIPDAQPFHSGLRLVDLVAAAPVALSLLVLPFMFGGQYQGWQAVAEASSFAGVAILGLAGKLDLFRRPGSRLLVGTLGVLAVGAGVSVALSPAAATSYPLFLEWLWLAATGLLAVALARRRRGRGLLVGALLLAVIGQVFWSFYLWWGSRTPTHAQAGTFYAPNQYAGYVLLLTPVLLAVCVRAGSRLTATGAGIAAAFLYLGIALSGSRAGVGAAVLGAAAAVAISRRSAPRAFLRSGLVVAAVAGLGLVMTSHLLFPRATHGAGSGAQGVLGVKGADPASLIMRLRWDVAAIRMGISHPLTGTGLGTFGAVLLKTMNPSWQWSLYAHNQYLEAFAEGGILLFAGMIALALVPLVAGARALWRRSTDLDPWRLGLWAGLVGASAHLLVDHDWSYPAYAVTFVVVAALVVSPWDRTEGPPAVRPRRAARVAIATVATVCLLAVATSYVSTRLISGHAPSDRALHLAARLAPYSSAPLEKEGVRLASSGTASDLTQAASLLRRAIQRNQLSPSLRWELAGVYAKLGDDAAARRDYEDAISLVPGSLNAYVLAANFELSDAHDLEGAARFLDKGIAQFRRGAEGSDPAPALVDLLASRAQIDEQLGRPGAALGLSEEATRVGPGLPEAWVSLHASACSVGATDLARQAAKKGLDLGAQPLPECTP